MRLSIERSPVIESLVSLGGSIAPEGRGDLPKQPRRSSRSYKAGRITRLDKDFLWNGQSQLPHVYRSLRILRSRSRELARNNGWFIKFLRMCRRNVIGPEGMLLECQAKTPRGKDDEKLNALIEQHWKTWSHKENASVNQRLAWLDLQYKWITILARDGEVLLRKVPANNPYGFALKNISVAWLDETFNEVRPNGNRVIMSVEVDGDGRHVAYWLTPPGDAYYAGLRPSIRQRTRVPAEEMIFSFLPFDQNCDDDETVTRGIPWAHAAMLNLWSLGAFEESAIIAARIGASKMGFFKNRAGDPLTLTPAELQNAADGQGPEEEDDDDPELFDHVEPGQFGDIGDKEFQEFNPTYPSDMVKPFNSAMIHGIAAGLGPEYFSFASDLTEVNFSAGRLGLEEERDGWRALQTFGAEHFYRPVHLEWLPSSMLSGTIPIDARELQRLQEPNITPRGYDYYDPLKDVQADEKAIALGIETRTSILAKRGRDFREVLETLKRENELAKELGVEINPPKAGSAKPDQEEKPKDPKDPNGDTAD